MNCLYCLQPLRAAEDVLHEECRGRWQLARAADAGLMPPDQASILGRLIAERDMVVCW